MPKGTTTQNELLKVAFWNNFDPAWRTNGNLYLALHTGDPSAGNQSTNEADYISYARVAVSKSATGWTISGNQSENAELIQFPQCSGGNNTVTHVSIGTASSGVGQILYCGALNSPLAVSNLIQPQFASGALVVEET